MTLPAVDSWNVRGVEGPPYKVGPYCSNPNCPNFADYPDPIHPPTYRVDAHHLVRRSALGKAFDWIAIDGFVIGNKTALCHSCHDDVTGVLGGHKAAIRWIQGEFWWCLVSFPDDPATPKYHAVAPIQPQPPTPDELATHDPHASDTGPESCPFCGQEKRRRSTPTRVGRRHRKSWTVLVPDEAIEDGADVLDSLVTNLAPLVPNADDSATGRYFVIVQALAYAMISGKDFVASFHGRNAA